MEENRETKCFTTCSRSKFLKEIGGVYDQTWDLQPIGDLLTHFFVIGCNSVNQLGARDILGICPVPALRG
jgi:hypothetical protein